MTVDTFGNSDDYMVGLEDVTSSDIAVPRLKIDHPRGMFVEKNSGLEQSTLKTIFLGVVKQRSMWDSNVEDNDVPQCRSTDNERGVPNVSPLASPRLQFPWARSNFNPADFPADIETGHVLLPCESCAFKEWGTGDNGKSVPPPCAEQRTFPLLYQPDGTEDWLPGILTLQKSSLPNAGKFISGFATRRVPMFEQITLISLDVLKRGSVYYSVPKFKPAGQTDREYWPTYRDQMIGMRDFLRALPRSNASADDGNVPSAAEGAARQAWGPGTASSAPATTPVVVTATPVVTHAAPTVAPTPAPERVTYSPPAESDDDLPF